MILLILPLDCKCCFMCTFFLITFLYANRYYEKPRLPVHCSENLEKAFRFMTEEEKLHLVNIGKCPCARMDA